MSDQLTLLALFKAKPEYADEVGRRITAMVAPTRAEPGCIGYDLHRSNEDPASWMLYENWRSEADLEHHFQTPHFREFVASINDVLAVEIELRRFSMTSPMTAPRI